MASPQKTRGSAARRTQRARLSEPGSEDLLRLQNTVLERIAGGAPLGETLDLLLRSIDALAPPVMSSILLLDEDGIHIRHASSPNLPPAYTAALDGAAIGDGVGSCGTAAYRGEPVITEDIATDRKWDGYRVIALDHGLRSCWSTPIFDDHRRVLGTFALYWPEPGRPDARHQILIDNATRAASIAITNHLRNKAIERSEERLRLAVKGGHIGIWEWRPAHRCFDLSDELKTMLGVDAPQGISAADLLALVHPEDRNRAEARLNQVLTGEEDYSEEFRVIPGRNSQTRWIAVIGRSFRDPEGGPMRMLGVALDTTERRNAAEEIQRREAQLASAQRLARFGSYEWETATGLVQRSDELFRIFGVRPEEFAPTLEGYLERVHPEDRASTRATIERSYRDLQPFSIEERIIRPDGEVRILYSRGQWELDAQGSPLKLTGTCQDITERKRTELQLQTANAELQALSTRLINAQEEERSRIARELHDDLSQQIAALSMAVSILKKGIATENQSLREQSSQIQHKLIQMATAVRQLSHRLHPAILEHAGLAAALRRYCSELRELTGLQVSLRTEGEFENVPRPLALAVYRVAQEALQNIVKHAGVPEASLSLVRKDGMLRLSISDHGCGMPVNSIAGSGLGLISMKERARLVNGTFEIQSDSGQGMTVMLTVPEVNVA